MISIIQGDTLQSLSRRLELDLPLWHSFSVCGAAPDPDPAGQGDPAPGGAGEGQPDPKPNDPPPAGDSAAQIRSLTEARERHDKKMADAERELNELREFKRKADQANLTDSEKAKADLALKEAEVATLRETTSRLAIENAFLANNSVKWHDSAAALKLIDLSEVKVEGGVVTNPDALKAAIDNLAKASPWLVADDEQPPPKKKTPPASGQPPQGGKPDPTSPDFEALARTYPALRHHRPYQTS